MKELVLKSDDGREYKVEDVNRFYQHLIFTQIIVLIASIRKWLLL